MADLYLYDDVPVLRNSLGIKDENTLDRIEAEQSRANMMLLYERGFHDFTPSGLCEIHHFLFGVLYDWVMKFNKEAKAAGTMKPFHKLRPIPQNHIDRLKPAGKIEEEQNEGYY